MSTGYPRWGRGVHTFRWDLDRTYLETEIHSVSGLVRAAFEDAGQKRTVPGAAALLRALVAADPAAQVCILSGSPKQMREVLLKKLALDGVRVDRLILKDNLRNLRRGRFRALRGQVGFKLPHLLLDRAGASVVGRETLFGDDSETDALVYAVYAAFLAGEIETQELVAVLEAGKAYPDTIDSALAAAARVPRADDVRNIFIRIDRGVPISTFRLLGPRVKPVFSWIQAAVTLYEEGLVSSLGLSEVARTSGTPALVGAHLVDGVRRRLFESSVVTDLSNRGIIDVPAHNRAELDRLGVVPEGPSSVPDYFGFLRAVSR